MATCVGPVTRCIGGQYSGGAYPRAAGWERTFDPTALRQPILRDHHLSGGILVQTPCSILAKM